MIQAVEDVTCTVCGCVCDDLTLHVADGRITEAERACALSKPWFLQQDAASNATPKITGTPATLETAIVAAAKILGASRAPLIYGLSTS
ncbi:MAG: hypothetical protein MI725_07895, partial [Pirellulales bacterium]|nr:hypothetical protein [Pirellulales bacterium]